MDRTISFLCLCALLATSPGCGVDLNHPCEGVDCDDRNICTLDRCTGSFFSGETTCHHDPTNDDNECGGDGMALVCRGGRCGAESLCDGVECNDDDLCTVDACEWDGICTFTPIRCDDKNVCTSDSCDSTTGACIHDAVDAVPTKICVPTEVPNDDNSHPFGVCEEGACAPPCDPGMEQLSMCPFLQDGAGACCPGSEYCQVECL